MVAPTLIFLVLLVSNIQCEKGYHLMNDEEENAKEVYDFFKGPGIINNAVLTTPYILPYGFPYNAPVISPYISPVLPLGVVPQQQQQQKTPDPYQGLHIKSDPGQNEPELWTPALKYYDILGLSKLFSKPLTPQKSFTKPKVRAQTEMTLCYFLGDDVQKSHLQFIPKWEFTNGIDMSGLHTYINELTLGANKLLGLQNYQFAWKGPYARLDKEKRYPDRLKEDTKRVAHLGCDAVVFMVFNDFSSGQNQVGHKYSGFAVGGPCEAAQEKGYAVIVDQGFKGEVWMGPQILAHHLLLMLTSDIYASNDPRRYCPNRNSLLHKSIFAGEQKLDQCVVDKLNQSNIGLRPCLND